MFADIIKVFTL